MHGLNAGDTPPFSTLTLCIEIKVKNLDVVVGIRTTMWGFTGYGFEGILINITMQNNKLEMFGRETRDTTVGDKRKKKCRDRFTCCFPDGHEL